MGEIVDMQGNSLSGPGGLKPGCIIVHCAMEPDTGNFSIYRSERNPPPQNNAQRHVELENWFSLLVNCVALLISRGEDSGVPKDKMIEAMNRMVQIYLDSGGTSGHRKKIVVDMPGSAQEKERKIKEAPQYEAWKKGVDFDSALIARGFKQLTADTFIEYCGRVGASDRDATLTPKATEFYNAIVFQKEISPSIYLEFGRDKTFARTADDETSSKYLAAVVLVADGFQRKFYWQITDTKNTSSLILKIEKEGRMLADSLSRQKISESGIFSRFLSLFKK